MDISAFKNLAERVSEIVDNVARAKAGEEPYFYTGFSFNFFQHNTEIRGPVNEFGGFCIIRHVKNPDRPILACTIYFAKKADSAKMTISFDKVSAGFENDIKASLEQFLQENQDLVELGEIKTVADEAEKSEQNQGSEVSRAETASNLMRERQRTVVDLTFFSVMTLGAIFVLVINQYIPIGNAIPIIFFSILGISCAIGIGFSIKKIRQLNLAIKLSKKTQETASKNVQP